MRKNPHVRICGGLGSATTLVYPTIGGSELLDTQLSQLLSHRRDKELWIRHVNPPRKGVRRDRRSVLSFSRVHISES